MRDHIFFLERRTFVPQELYATDARQLYKNDFVLWYNAYKTKGKKIKKRSSGSEGRSRAAILKPCGELNHSVLQRF